MPVGVNSGIAAILCAVIVTTGGCLSRQHERRDPKGGPVIERSANQGKPGEVPSGSPVQEKKCGRILLVPQEEPGRL